MRRLVAALPVFRWLPGYQKEWLGLDVLAGTTLAAYAVPNAVAYALLAGLPPVAGLAGYLFGGLAYALFGTSRRLALGPTSAISLLVATTIGPLAAGDAHRYAALAGASALLVGAMALAAAALRWGGIAHFLSEPVLAGYKFGAALVIATTQLPALLGVPAVGGSTLSRLSQLARHLWEAQPWVLGVGLLCLGLLEIGQRLGPRLPVGLAVVLASMAASQLLGLASHGVSLVGPVPEGLPHLLLPEVKYLDVRQLVPLAVACFLLAYLEGMASARAFAGSLEEKVDPNRELVALGVANLALGVGQGYPAGGGFSQSAVNARAGARTPLSLVVTSGWMALLLLFAVGAFSQLPHATLAALVVASVTGLLDVKELRRLARASPSALALAVVSCVGVVYLGILQGVILAALLSLALILRAEASLRVSELGAIQGAQQYADRARHPTARCPTGTLALRIDGPLLYFNTDSVESRILEAVAKAEPGLGRLLLDMSFTTELDVSVGDMLRRLSSELRPRGVALFLADVHHQVRADLLRQGLGALLVETRSRLTVAETLAQLDSA
ncbi:MAG: SulP family inorganic anion transporter [Myxococcaceae bacterium]